MTAVRAWTGREACALGAAMRLSIRDFAEVLGVGVRTVTKWQARGDDVCLRPGMQSVLDTALERASDEVRARFELILTTEESPTSAAPTALAVPPSLLAEQWDHEQTDGLAEFLADERELTSDTALLLSQEWRAADDKPLAANLLSSLSYQVANTGDPRDAVLPASTAYHGAEPSATATTRALLLERVAWANARFGDPQATARTLDRVDEAFADSNPEDDPPWVYWLDRDEIDVMAGRCLTELRQPKKAIALLNAAVQRYDDSRAREKALYLSWLAEAHVYDGDIEEAASAALQALHLSASTSSARSLDRVKVVQRALEPYAGNAAVDEFEGQAAELLDHRGQ